MTSNRLIPMNRLKRPFRRLCRSGSIRRAHTGRRALIVHCVWRVAAKCAFAKPCNLQPVTYSRRKVRRFFRAKSL